MIAGFTPTSLQYGTTTAGPGQPPGYQTVADSPPSYDSLHSQYPSARAQHPSAAVNDHKS